jgi:hypothetical protein
VSVRISTDKLLDFVNKNYRFETVKLSEFIAKVFDPSLVEKFYFRSIGENMRKGSLLTKCLHMSRSD